VLIEVVMPKHDVVERHAIFVDRDAATTWRALWEVDLFQSPVVRVLLRLRAFAATTPGPGVPGRRSLTLADLPTYGFVLLADSPGREVVYGLIGPVWSFRFRPHAFDRGDFARLPERNGVRVAFSFSVLNSHGGTKLSTETRVLAADDESRRRFSRYWLLVAPFSALMRRAMLRQIRSVARKDRSDDWISGTSSLHRPDAASPSDPAT
jgi:hypothetical protein